MRRLPILMVLSLAACRGVPASAHASVRSHRARAARDTIRDTIRDTLRDSTRRAADTVRDSARAAATDTTRSSVRPPSDDTAIVRALYVNRWASQNHKRMRELIEIADSTEINALVVDLKDEFGLNFESKDSLLTRNAGKAGRLKHLAEFLDTLKAHHILAIARVVVFKDSVAARVNPQHIIRQPDGKPWRDKKGLTWVDPYDRFIWEYDIRVAETLARAGFGEIQFDYIRFPEPYPSLPEQTFKDAKGVSKARALANFFRAACPRVRAAGARCTADVFGLVTSVSAGLEVGQRWSELAPVTDVLLPMVYPSHYPAGAYGAPHPNAAPYVIVHSALVDAHRHDLKLGITNSGHVRAWLQAFTLGAPHYTAKEIAEQTRAVYDAGYDSWTLWHPGSEYAAFLPALERATVTKRKPFFPDSTTR